MVTIYQNKILESYAQYLSKLPPHQSLVVYSSYSGASADILKGGQKI